MLLTFFFMVYCRGGQLSEKLRKEVPDFSLLLYFPRIFLYADEEILVLATTADSPFSILAAFPYL